MNVHLLQKNKVFSGLNGFSSAPEKTKFFSGLSQPIKNLFSFFFYSFFLKKIKFPKFIQNFGFN